MINERKIDAIKKGKPISIIDIIIIVTVLTAALLLIFLVVYRSEGSYLSITYNGEEIFYSLSEDITIEVEAHLKVRIKDGYAYVLYADCDNQDCKDYGGKIKYVGQKIVCLPNKIVLKIVATNENDPEWATT